MPYWQLYYHLVWSTKNRQPILTAAVEPVIFQLLREKALQLEATVFEINGTMDHVHLIAAIPPKIAVATFVGQVKATSSTLYNKKYPTPAPFFWQDEYGAFSFDKKRLPNVTAYVRNQKEHHTQGSIVPLLERSENVDRTKESASDLYLADELDLMELPGE